MMIIRVCNVLTETTLALFNAGIKSCGPRLNFGMAHMTLVPHIVMLWTHPHELRFLANIWQEKLYSEKSK